MKIETLYFETVEVDEKDIIHFENGLPGFQSETEFVMLDLEGNPAFKVLQSVQTESLAFVVTNPFLIQPDYEFKLDDSTIEQLNVKQPEHISVWSIVTLKEPFEKSTHNLQAPVVINNESKKAKQISLNHPSYHTKHSIKGGEHQHVSSD
ncbi:flagellar assembly protein FliW [Alkalibacillus haloalkaliphilus]|uniref:flagellar assembly protein FliW n=1 Tax=Alkalibacillus haloalkaliphilus TaxID=94136 RepID=UPI0002F723BC|nr:flagellar assembly protein FliW [Alkalibacillus haloalkaliphilus]